MAFEMWKYFRMWACDVIREKKMKKVIALSGYFGMDQYVSWSLSTEELMLDTIWEKFEEFCKPQSNVVRARFDLLKSFCHWNRSVSEWYNAVQTQVALAKYLLQTAKIHHRDIRCRILILLNKSWSRLVFSGTVHWFCSKTSFQLLL